MVFCVNVRGKCISFDLSLDYGSSLVRMKSQVSNQAWCESKLDSQMSYLMKSFPNFVSRQYPVGIIYANSTGFLLSCYELIRTTLSFAQGSKIKSLFCNPWHKQVRKKIINEQFLTMKGKLTNYTSLILDIDCLKVSTSTLKLEA